MRIELFGASSSAISESADAGAAAGPEASRGGAAASFPTAVPASPEDTATLSGNGAVLSSLTAQALQTGSMMEARVQGLREAVNGGRYAVEPSEIADAMLSDGM